MPIRKRRKRKRRNVNQQTAVANIVGTSLIASTGSLALAGLPSTASTHGQQGLSNATRFLPVTGSLVGIQGLMHATKSLHPKKRRRR